MFFTNYIRVFWWVNADNDEVTGKEAATLRVSGDENDDNVSSESTFFYYVFEWKLDKPHDKS